MKHLMIDLETMSLEPNGAIVSIGAVFFDETTLGAEFHQAIRLDSCVQHGLHVSQSTSDWWAQQSPEARSSWDNGTAVPLMDALIFFTAFLKDNGPGHKQLCPWGNGAAYDPVLLESAFKAVDCDAPWMFYNVHCFRTMKNLFQVHVERQGTHHSAIDDAKHQVRHLQEICRVHGVKL